MRNKYKFIRLLGNFFLRLILSLLYQISISFFSVKTRLTTPNTTPCNRSSRVEEIQAETVTTDSCSPGSFRRNNNLCNCIYPMLHTLQRTLTLNHVHAYPVLYILQRVLTLDHVHAYPMLYTLYRVSTLDHVHACPILYISYIVLTLDNVHVHIYAVYACLYMVQNARVNTSIHRSQLIYRQNIII